MKVNSQAISYNRPEEDESFNFKSVILKYLSYRGFFIGSIAVAMLIAFMVNQCTPPVYKIQSKFLIKDESNPVNLFDFRALETNSGSPKGQKLANETVIIKSRAIAEDALDLLSFDVEYFDEGLFIDSEIYKSIPVEVEVDWSHTQLANGRMRLSWSDYQTFDLVLLDDEYQKISPGEKAIVVTKKPTMLQTRFSFGQPVIFPHGKFVVNSSGFQPEGSLIIKIRDRESLVQQYTGENLQILSADKTSSILQLTLDTGHPEKGSDYLNTLMKVFLENELDEKNTTARNTINFIDRQLSGISDSLSQTENKLEQFRSSNRTYNISTEATTIFEKLSELEKSLSQERFKRDYYANLQEYLVNENYSEILVPAGLGIDDPVLNKLVGQLIGYQSDKSRFLATQTESSPTVQEVNRKIKDINGSIHEALRNVNRNSGLVINDLQRRISRIESQFGKLPQTEQNLLHIKRKNSLNENIYTFLLQRRAEAAIALASNMASNKVIESAVPNFVPMHLRPLLNYIMALLVGLLAPICVISIREAFSVKVSDVTEVEKMLNVPVVGCIGQNKKYPPVVVLTHPRAGITEAFRALRTNLDFIIHKDSQVTVMITSTIAGEGKSFCAMNLGSVYSMCGKKTLIVECDMHKPFNPAGFELTNARGLSNFLSGQVTQVNAIVQQTGYPNLDVLVPGPVPPNPAELLINNRFKQLMQELKLVYDVIILDSSPLGLTNETLYLTRMTDVTLFVLRQGYSDKSFCKYINSLKEKKGIKKLYAVMNDVEDKYIKHHGHGYGYYDDDVIKVNPLASVLKRVLNKAAF